jgi:two-component system, OmpR family, sensor histidine kinase BaeS
MSPGDRDRGRWGPRSEEHPWGPWGPHRHGPWAQGWRPGGGRHLVRRIGCALVAFGLFAVGGLSIVAWLIAAILGGSTRALDWVVPLALGALAVIAIGAFGAFRTFGRLARPVAEVMDATERLADGDLEARVEVSGPPPVRRLAGSFNRMAQRLAAAEDRRRALLADVSHELRTPLTVIGGGLEAIVDGVHPADAAHLEPLIEETRVLSRLIEDLRTFSLSEAGALALRREEVDAGELVDEVAAAFEATAVRAGLSIRAGADPDLPPIRVDPIRVREVLSNLMTNAIRHTPTGGAVVLSARSTEPDWLELTVTDTGEGIPPHVLGAVFDRYQRSDRGESGLGLAIARSLVVAHGGTIVAESTGTGQGTTIRIRIPVDT